jgi:hypothetical protein
MNKLERIYKMIDDTSIGEYEKDINFFDLKPIGCIKDKEQHLEMDLFHYEKENLTILDQYDGNNNIYTAARNLKKDKIIQYIDRLRADTRRLTSESVSKEVEKLDTLYLEAREKKQYTAAVNAIRLKSQLLGFLIEKKEVQHSTLDAMSDDDLSKYLDQIKQEHEIN